MAKPERSLPRTTNLVAHFLSLPPEWRRLAVDTLAPDDRAALDHHWPSWAHDGQLEPAAGPHGEWRTWVMMAGRGFGKTRAGSEWVVEQVRAADAAGEPPPRIALVAATLHEARRVMVEGISGLLAVADGWIAGWHSSIGRLQFRGGAEANLFSGASPDGLRGPEHHLAWCDELAKWERPGDCWDMLQLGLRLGPRPRALITTTPRAGPDMHRIIASPGTIVTGGRTVANPHLPPAFIAAVQAMYGGTRLGRQELDGVMPTDLPGALWTVEMLEASRAPLPLREGLGVGASAASQTGNSFTRIAIGVDPPIEDGTCGIIACALDHDGIGHVLADHSIGGVRPEAWARKVIEAAALYPDALTVVEVNQGGKMVERVLRTAGGAAGNKNDGAELRIKPVRAHDGKTARAEPVAMLFEQGRVQLHGRFHELEAQLTGMIAGGRYQGPGASPDRADAMVWALGELMLHPKSEPRVTQF